jgi:hypothetical protein
MSYADWGVLWFSSVRPDECRDCTLKWGHDQSFHIHPDSSFAYGIIISFAAIVWVTETASLNDLQMNKQVTFKDWTQSLLYLSHVINYKYK